MHARTTFQSAVNKVIHAEQAIAIMQGVRVQRHATPPSFCLPACPPACPPAARCWPATALLTVAPPCAVVLVSQGPGGRKRHESVE